MKIIKGKPTCPGCRSTERIILLDRGVKLLWRWMGHNNRFACTKCKVTWRRRDRHNSVELVRRESEE